MWKPNVLQEVEGKLPMYPQTCVHGLMRLSVFFPPLKAWIARIKREWYKRQLKNKRKKKKANSIFSNCEEWLEKKTWLEFARAPSAPARLCSLFLQHVWEFTCLCSRSALLLGTCNRAQTAGKQLGYAKELQEASQVAGLQSRFSSGPRDIAPHIWPRWDLPHHCQLAWWSPSGTRPQWLSPVPFCSAFWVPEVLVLLSPWVHQATPAAPSQP